MRSINIITYIIISILLLAGAITVSAETAGMQASHSFEQSADVHIEQAAAGDQIGEILKTHACPIHGYNLIIARPAGYSAGASERVIQVEKTNRFFNATWNEVENLISNYLPNELEYNQLSQNPGPGGERYCNRNGHMIPTDMNVYQVSLAHYNDYTGQTSIFADSNLEVAPLINVLHAYNQHRVFGDELPPTCNYGCMDGSSGVVPDENSWDDINFGEIDWGTSDPRNPANDLHDGIDPGVGGSDNSEYSTEAMHQAISVDTIDPDADPDQSEVEWQINTQQDNEDAIGDDDIVFAQDYNSTRSNKRENIFVEDPLDQDSIMRYAARTQDNGGDIDERLYCWGKGACYVAQGEGESVTGIRIRGSEVRAWQADERDQWSAIATDLESESRHDRLMKRATEMAHQYDFIQDIEINDEKVSLTIESRSRLFGFIPLRVRTQEMHITGDERIERTAPWYRFLTTSPQSRDARSALKELFDITYQ